MDLLSGALRAGSWLAADVNLDITALISGVFFILVWIALKLLIFDPYLNIVEEREEQIEGARDRAASMEARAEEALERYDERMKVARAEASERREELREAGEVERNSLLSDARESARAHVEQHREKLDQEIAEAEKVIDKQANELSKAIVDRVLTAKG
jgi:F-type H+-transporting ATPase subunit b